MAAEAELSQQPSSDIALTPLTAMVLASTIVRPRVGYDIVYLLRCHRGFLAVSNASVYKALERLKKSALIGVVGPTQVTLRGVSRSRFLATTDGRRVFGRWLNSQPRNTQPEELLGRIVNTRDIADLRGIVDRYEQACERCEHELAQLRPFAQGHGMQMLTGQLVGAHLRISSDARRKWITLARRAVQAYEQSGEA